jgi:lysine decarboxylase
MGRLRGHPLLALLQAPPPALPLHLPAHGRGRALAPELASLLRRRPGSWDLPELPDWGGPLEAEGAVADSQARCAALFGAEHCWFGVNGASGLLQAALLGLAAPGERVLLPRNLHRSLLHGCVLGQLEPLLYTLPFDPLSGLWQPPDPAHLERVLQAALATGPVAALVLVSPTYQGLAADLPALIALAHRHGLPVLVDQAHGRGEAVAAGAELTVLSPQKNAGGLAQSAALLAQGTRPDAEAIERALLWLQTSSPSALLLASTALALEDLCSERGQRQRRRAEARGRRLRQRLETLGFSLLANGDPLRLGLLTAPLGFSGLEADAWLLERGVVAELPEPGCLTFLLGLDPPATLERLLPRRLAELRMALAAHPLPPFTAPPLPLVTSPERPLGEAWRAPRRRLPLGEAVGCWAAEPLCPYPPGIPLLVPGERIDAARAAWLENQRPLWGDQIPDGVAVVDGDAPRRPGRSS